MPGDVCITKEPKGLGFFEVYLTIFVPLCIGIGILLGNFAPELARYLDSLAIYVGDAPVISITGSQAGISASPSAAASVGRLARISHPVVDR